jgi:hypothetical protein
VHVRAFALTAGVWLDEYAAPTDPNAPLVLVQSVALPNSSAAPTSRTSARATTCRTWLQASSAVATR